MLESVLPYLGPIGLILLALLAGVVSPGPSFVQVARIAVSRSRADGLAAAAGMGLGALVFAMLALAGLQALLAALPGVYMALKVVGGLYLMWMALNIWRGARQPLEMGGAGDGVSRQTVWQSFRLGLVTQLSNPKIVVVYSSVFAALLPAQFPLPAALLVLAGVLVMETGWYAVVALVLSSTVPRAAYLRSKALVDRVAAGAMGLLGLRLVATAHVA
ncbi:MULTISPECIES: LysE family translocator [unclassified Polaromonas]|uniref:LysE family translocator n=1 Tax=unclassified Polaromonas TaxID=2638319 RepID=UPI000F08D0F5|nr:MULTISPECIES: LysE family transporter [unclassified Polaromonas]AYQ30647.1 LysE family translocator [Polaromonas sp. SP1]QGJ18704.1 LysE family translocator [Polaromonas sp. Pch-P]